MARTPGTSTWRRLLAHRARKLPRELVGARVEQAFRDLCLELAPTVSLEVGAHEAEFSRWLKSEIPSAHCVAFEANPFVHDKFADDLGGTGVEYHHLAVSLVNGTVDLGIPRRFHNPLRGRRFRKRRTSRMASLSRHRYAERTEIGGGSVGAARRLREHQTTTTSWSPGSTSKVRRARS